MNQEVKAPKLFLLLHCISKGVIKVSIFSHISATRIPLIFGTFGKVTLMKDKTLHFVLKVYIFTH